MNKLWQQLAGIILFLSLVGSAEAGVLQVHLQGLEIGIDEATGSIVSLASPATGLILAARPESAGLLDVAYPVNSFAAMRLASRFSQAPSVQQSSQEVVIKWAKLGASRPNLALPGGEVSATVTLRAAGDGKSVIFTCRIENGSQAAIRQELFPDLWGMKPYAGIEGTRLRLARGVVEPFAEPTKPPYSAPFYADDLGWKSYRAGSYYNENALRWLDYGGYSSGLSVFQRKWGTPDWPDVLTHRSEHDPMSLRLAWEHKQEIAPGQSWDSGEFWLTPHHGGWAKGIETYRDYVRQVNPPHPVAPQVRDNIGFQTIWMIQTVEVDPAKAAFRYKDLPRVAEDARQYGIDEIVPWGWCTYSTLPIPIRSELGTVDDLIEGVRGAGALGVNIAPFISIAIVRNRLAGRYGAKPGSSDWTYHYELIPMFRPYYTKFWDGASVDTNNPGWEQDVLSALGEWIKRGVASFCWDVFEAKARDDTPPGLLTTIANMRTLARAKDPDSTFSGESVSHLEFDSPALDYTWNWLDYEDAAPITSVLRTPRLNCNVEDSPLVVKKAFADNLYLNVMPRKLDQPNGTALISEKPVLAGALKQVAALRKQFLPYFAQGTFIGDSVLREPTPAFVRGYQHGNNLLVIVLNDQDRTQAVSVESDLDLWLPATDSYQVKYYDSHGKLLETQPGRGSRWFGTTRRLEPQELAVFEIEGQ